MSREEKIKHMVKLKDDFNKLYHEREELDILIKQKNAEINDLWDDIYGQDSAI